MRLEDTVIVITGSSTGLGKAMADAFVREGAHVVCSARTESRLNDAVAEINNGPGKAIGISADVRDETDIDRLVAETESEFGPIDVFVNNAGILQDTVTAEHRRIDEISTDVWDTIIETNLRGVFLCSRAVLPDMRQRGEGRLIHLSSGMGSHGRARWGPYVASKYGVEGLADTIALECEGTGVSSVLFRPPRGGVYTENRDHSLNPEDVAHEPAVIAEPAVKLASGAGTNGDRYAGSADGTSLVPYSRSET